jgi:hypothetical protein
MNRQRKTNIQTQQNVARWFGTGDSTKTIDTRSPSSHKAVNFSASTKKDFSHSTSEATRFLKVRIVGALRTLKVQRINFQRLMVECRKSECSLLFH